MHLKQAVSFVLSLVFAGVPATARYAEAVRYVSEKGLMSGTGARNFSPDIPMTRAMLTAVLYRNEGQPPVVDIGAFSDMQGSWYASAANWAAASGIVSGYGNGRFGENGSYYGSDSVRETYAKLREMHQVQGLSDREINELAVMDLKPQSYFLTSAVSATSTRAVGCLPMMR